MAIMMIIVVVGALILSIFGYFTFKAVIEDLSMYISIACVVGVVILLFLAIKKWGLLEKIGLGKKKK